MKKTILIVIAVMLAVTLFAGCSAGGTQSQDAWRINGSTVTFTLRDISGSSGYVWSYENSNPDVLAFVKDNTTANPSGVTGASATKTYEFKAGADGNTTLVFSQTSPGGAQDGDRIRYEVNVSGGKINVG